MLWLVPVMIQNTQRKWSSTLKFYFSKLQKYQNYVCISLHAAECNCITFLFSYIICFIHENEMQMIPLKYPERTQHPNIIVIRLSFKSVSVEAAKKPGNLDESKVKFKVQC